MPRASTSRSDFDPLIATVREIALSPMKVLLVHNSYQTAGGEDRVYETERDLLRAYGHEVIEYRRTNKEIEEYSILKRLLLAKRAIYSLPSRRDFAEALRAAKPDLVHIHNTFMVISPSIYGACREQGIAVVQTLHNYRLLCPAANFIRDGDNCHDCISHLAYSVLHGCYRGSRANTAVVASMLGWHRFKGTYLELIDRYIALSEFARDVFVSSGRFEAGKMAVKPNCVFPDPGERSEDGRYALYFGRMDREKGVDTLLNAWRSLPEIPLRLAGAGPLAGEVEAAAAQMPQVKYLGALSRDRLLTEIKGARFVVAPSICYENFPMSVAEAYACGVPVLASDLGAMREIVKHGRTGLLFRPADCEDLGVKALLAWNNRQYAEKLGRQARKEYEAKYTGERNYEMLRRIYESVLPNSDADMAHAHRAGI